MNRVFTLDTAAALFSRRNCKLISTQYINTREPLDYIATCGHAHRISLSNFKAGKGDLCKACRYQEIAKQKTYTIDFARKVFSDAGCKLLSTNYVSAQSEKLSYIATCGHENQINLSKFLSGVGVVCRKCSRSVRYEHSYVYEYFTNEGCVLLSEYINCKTPLDFIAQCGHNHTLTFDGFRSSSKKCPQCQERIRYTTNDVNAILLENGCQLTSTEYNPSEQISYIAQCGHRTKISFGKFMLGQGRRCNKCSRPSGMKHHKYNPELTDADRASRRDLYEIIKWRNSVYERDSHTCIRCGKHSDGDLNAHHLEGYSQCVERRFVVSNGVTLCKKCHMEFHARVGYGNNTEVQFVEWMADYAVAE